MDDHDPSFDLVSSLNMRCFNFVLHQLLPATRLLEAMQGIQSKVAQSPGAARFLNQDEVLFSGSMAEGLSVPLVIRKDDVAVREIVEADVDIMSIVAVDVVAGDGPVPKRTDLLLEPIADFAGYVRLRVVDGGVWRAQDVVQGEDGQYYLSSVTWKHDILHALLRRLGDPHKPTTMVISGPAVKTKTREVEGAMRHLDAEMDLVVCLPVRQWPAPADEWVSRPRPRHWPRAQVRDELVAGGAHLVCLGHPRHPRPDLLFRLSFSRAEKTLALGLTPTQRQAYVLLKALHAQAFREPRVLSSYYLKNVLFWTCEQLGPDPWVPGKLAACLLLLLDKLTHFLSTHHLPHYFVRTNNLLRYAPRDHVNEVCRKVVATRKDPLKYLLLFNKTLKFSWGPLYTNMETVLRPVLGVARCPRLPPGLAQTLEAGSRRLLAGAYLEETVQVEQEVYSHHIEGALYDQLHAVVDRRYDTAVGLFSETCRAEGAMGRHVTVEQLLVPFLDELNSYAVKAGFIIYLLNRFEHSDYVPQFYNCLGGIYHRIIYKETKEKEKVDRTRDAYMSYHRALEHPKCPGWVYVEFANFLCRLQRYGEAIDPLQKALEKEPQDGESRHLLIYKEHQEDVVCDEIQYVLRRRPPFVVTSSILAHFLLVKCHLVGRQAVNVKHAMFRFRLAVRALGGDEAEDGQVKANAYFLMACACYQDRRWDVGVKNADRALGHVTNHVGALWMKHWCIQRKDEVHEGSGKGSLSRLTEGKDNPGLGGVTEGKDRTWLEGLTEGKDRTGLEGLTEGKDKTGLEGLTEGKDRTWLEGLTEGKDRTGLEGLTEDKDKTGLEGLTEGKDRTG